MLEHLKPRKAAKKRVWKLRGRRKRRATGERAAGLKLALNGSIPNIVALERLAMLAATIDEAAIFFGCSQPIIHQRFRDHPEMKAAWDHGRASAQISLRRNLYNRALRPDAAGAQAALFLARWTLGFGKGEREGFIEKPAKDEKLSRLTAEEQAQLAALLEKAGGARPQEER